jgi:quercetin dioxygenase-like cupin family protein
MTIPQTGLVSQAGEGSSYWVLGDLYTFKAVGADTGEAYALFEVVVQPQSGTPPHRHTQENESFYVQEGTFEFQLEAEAIVATAGMFLHSPKGQLHRFTNIGSAPAKMLVWVTPAGFEKFVAEVGLAAKAQITRSPGVNPADLEKILAAAPKYGIEILPI